MLTREATLNVEMDSQAKAKLAPTAGMGPMVIPFKGWACCIGSKKIIKQWMLMLREQINGENILHYWKQKK